MIFKSDAKNREKRVDESTSRGNYTLVIQQPGLKHGLSVGQKLLQLTPMVGSLIGGVILVLIHHMFYSHLDEKRIDPGAMELPTILMNQKTVTSIGRAIAHGARILLAFAIGVTFIQSFWDTLRSRSHTVEQIDALVNCDQSPFNPSAFRAATASIALYAIALVVSATSLVVVLTPGSLTVSTNFQRNRPCVVPTVPRRVMASSNIIPSMSVADTDAKFLWLHSITASMLTSNTYLPPFQNDLASVCGDNVPSCSYNVSFIGPALDCIDVTDGTNFSSITDPFQPMVWNAKQSENSMNISILSWDLENDVLQATNCTAYNATYNVTVNLDASAAAKVQVRDVDTNAILQKDDSFLSFFTSLGLEHLSGECIVELGATGSTDCGLSLGPLLVTTSTGNLTFSDTIPHFASSFIQNTSISLLSGNTEYGVSNDTGDAANNLENISTTCSSLITVYAYNSTRLLLAYGLTLAVTVVLVVFGTQLVLCNGAKPKIFISDLIDIALNEDMLRAEEKLGRRTQIQLFGEDSEQRKFLPLLTDPAIFTDESAEEPTARPLQDLPSTNSKFLTTAHWKMALSIFGTFGTMGLNHAFYQYIDGKEPSPSLRLSNSSGWLLNQTVVSDIGIALAYAGHSFLSVAIATSCHQVFWRAIRHRGHTISGINSVMKVQGSPLSLSIIPALRVSITVPILALLAVSTALVSIFAPGSYKVATDFTEHENCTVLAPRDLLTLMVNEDFEGKGGGDLVPQTVLALGSYLPPIDVCGSSLSGSRSRCSYSLQFMGPGFDCGEATTSSNSSGSAAMSFQASIISQTADDLSLRVFVQAWDAKRSTYQTTNCTSVIRLYSVFVQVSNGSIPVLDVTDSQIVSTIQANSSQFGESQLSAFTEDYVLGTTGVLVGLMKSIADPSPLYPPILSMSAGGIGTVLADGNITWNADLAQALEDFSRNATLSVLSGQVLTFNPDVPYILENTMTSCTYTSTAYEYSPHRLFLTYGIGILVATLCAIWGSVAIWWNGVDESMEFSRMLHAILNERMYNARENLIKDTVIKADETPEGALAPLDS